MNTEIQTQREEVNGPRDVKGRGWSGTAGNARAASNHQKPGGGIDQKFPRAFGRSLALLIP